MPRLYADGCYFRKSQEINMGGNKIINLGDPTNATDGVNLQTLNGYIKKAI